MNYASIKKVTELMLILGETLFHRKSMLQDWWKKLE